jgi:glucuronoarabinoxylan endo-1,4-beta-xylanase
VGGLVTSIGVLRNASAQTATVTLSSPKQYIRAFGGMSHAAWAGDLTAAERALAFGNGAGQLGLTALRIPVTDGSPDSANVATAKAAIAAGAIVFATPWNAAGTMTSSQFSSYATHLNNFVAYMKNQGVDLYAIGVQNEPDYGTQGGWLAWSAALCHDFVLNYGPMITTKLMSCESFSYNKSYYDPILNDSAALANVEILGTHLYGTPVSSYPYPLFDQKGAGKERWMTEHYTDSTTNANSWPNALGVATELHHAMVDGQFNLYTWWYIVRSYGLIYTDGTVSKRGWCMAHFSKFIRPGFHRVDATATPASGVYVSAYKSDTGDVVVVVVNTNTSTQPLTVSLNGSSISSYDTFTTSGSKSLANGGMVTVSNGSVALSLDAESVTTLYGTGSSTSSSSSSSTSSSGSSSSSGGSTGPGGSTGSGGVMGTGGSSGVGGATGTGGSKATGASTGSGGGATSTGGSASAGGAPFGTGGLSGSSAGGSTSTGGNGTKNAAGCSCRIHGDQSESKPLALLGILGAVALVSKRRPASTTGKKRMSHAHS